MVGGAISIDRFPRKKADLTHARAGSDRRSYWFDEHFVLNEDELNKVKGVRYVVTHSIPRFVPPVNDFNNQIDSHGFFVEQFCFDDPTLKGALNQERSDLSKMYELLKSNNYIEKWVCGHFHKHYTHLHEDTEFIILDCNQFYELK